MNAGPFSPRANVPVGGAPAGLVSWCVVTTSPVGVLRKPAGTIAFQIGGLLAWLNVDGTPAGWIPVSTLGALAALAPILPQLLAVAQELRSQYSARGRTLTGIAGATEVIFDDFGLTDVNAFALGGATVGGTSGRTRSATERTAWQWGTGATAGSTAYLEALRAGAWIPASIGAAPWYLAFRMKVTTAVDAQTLLCATIGDGTGNYVRVGVVGAASAVNFGMLAGVAVLDSGVAVDGNPHIFEVYRAGANIHLLIDGVDRGSLAPPAWGAHCELLPLQIYNGTTAANRACAHYWYLALTEAA